MCLLSRPYVPRHPRYWWGHSCRLHQSHSIRTSLYVRYRNRSWRSLLCHLHTPHLPLRYGANEVLNVSCVLVAALLFLFHVVWIGASIAQATQKYLQNSSRLRQYDTFDAIIEARKRSYL
jgi:hypothetical protein